MNGWQVRNYRHGLMLIALCSLITIPVHSSEKPKTPLENGRAVALTLCQACHTFKGTDQAGTVGPPFVSMSQRFPSRVRLRDIIYDPQTAIKTDTMMPPFGRHGFLNKRRRNN